MGAGTLSDLGLECACYSSILCPLVHAFASKLSSDIATSLIHVCAVTFITNRVIPGSLVSMTVCLHFQGVCVGDHVLIFILSFCRFGCYDPVVRVAPDFHAHNYARTGGGHGTGTRGGLRRNWGRFLRL